MESTRKTLLTNADIRAEYRLGRALAYRLARLLPHIPVGRTGRGEILLVRREDMDRLVSRAAAEKADLLALSAAHTPESLEAWLNREIK